MVKVMIERGDRKRKDYKKAQRDKGKENHNPYDAEMLRIQGLIRCHNCELTYPFMQSRCPNCDSPNREHYPSKV